MKEIIIKPGDTYGGLTIIKEIEPYISPAGHRNRKMLCQCDCGNKTEVRLGSLRSGNTTSCGCSQREISTKHGLKHHPLYSVWVEMKKRCNNTKNKNYKYYGGRGIKVCPQWLDDFQCFYDWAMANGWQKELQIDRIDNDGHYEPSNCRFVTPRENVLNQRIRSDNTSGYRNVSYDKRLNKWRAHVGVNGKLLHIGCYTTAEEAAIAYNKYVTDNNLPNNLNVI